MSLSRVFESINPYHALISLFLVGWSSFTAFPSFLRIDKFNGRDIGQFEVSGALTFFSIPFNPLYLYKFDCRTPGNPWTKCKYGSLPLSWFEKIEVEERGGGAVGCVCMNVECNQFEEVWTLMALVVVLFFLSFLPFV